MLQKEVRSYEVSIWTLQDEFITVLKPANIEYKGQIQDGSLTLDVDGTQELSFSIPMYIRNNEGILIENPIWYNYTNGVIIADMRKIKVIINKNILHDEEVFEFIITNVSERHEKDELYCDVKCEGLAFNELGKIGYKINLATDDFYAEDLEWFNKPLEDFGGSQAAKDAAQPHATLQYWLNKFMEPYPENPADASPAVWYYIIDMNWNSYTGYKNMNTTAVDIGQVAYVPRDKDKVYEDEYVASWKIENGQMIPDVWEGYKEKERLVDLQESNKYNLTQDLAETFGIYCKYIYEHDENYYITARKIIFYNSFIEEDEGIVDINYKYNTTSITREMDSSDLVTKMFVRPVDSDIAASGLLTIMDVGANKSREDYIMNFDYMYQIGAIDKDRYDTINEYEKKMYQYNMSVIPIQEKLISLNLQLPEEKAKLKTAQTSIALDQQRITSADGVVNRLTGDTGILTRNELNPDQKVLLQDKDEQGNLLPSYYISFSEKGIDGTTIHIYRDFDYMVGNSQLTFTDELLTGQYKYDDGHFVTEVHNLYPASLNDDNVVYVTYSYSPKLYYEKVKEIWIKKLAQDEAEEQRATEAVQTIETQIRNLEAQQKAILAQKEADIKDFERLMGPALREGYWQPEDYSDYGDRHTDTLNLNISNTITAGSAGIDWLVWDDAPFSDELKSYYESGAQQEKIYYPYIDLSDILNNILSSLNNQNISINKLNYSFYSSATNKLMNSDTFKRYFGLDADCKFAFIKDNNGIKPALVLTGAQKLSESELAALVIMHTEASVNGGKFGSSGTIGYITSDSAGFHNNVIINAANGSAFYIDDELTETKYNYNTNKFQYKKASDSNWNNLNTVSGHSYKSGNIKLIYPREGRYAYDIVYPRLMIKSLKLKTSTDQFAMKYNNKELKDYDDYYILNKFEPNTITVNRENVLLDIDSYYITIKPETIISNLNSRGQLGGPLNVLFSLSNADTAVYLDAIEVLKDSSQPQVSYTMNVSMLQIDYIRTIYKILNRIVHINDSKLKFKNVMGYISKVTLDLDRPWQDTVESKNYKTKFEDLFTKIIASTEQMKKSSYISGIVSNAFTSTGEIKPTVVQSSLDNNNINYKFNNGRLTIDQSNGILATSDEGVIALRGGGLFCANEQDENGEWVWRSLLTPAGINAEGLTAGQLNTNNLIIAAGERPRLQLNQSGVYAYKSFLSDFDGLSIEDANQAIQNTLAEAVDDYTNGDGIDPTQYVVMNEEGLFLIAEEGAKLLNKEKTDYLDPLEQRVERVAITWDGLTLRNYEDEPVFYADPDTGNLNITGNITATGLTITKKIKDEHGEVIGTEEEDFEDYYEELYTLLTDTLDEEEQEINSQLQQFGAAQNEFISTYSGQINSNTTTLTNITQNGNTIKLSALGTVYNSTDDIYEDVSTVLARAASIQVNPDGSVNIDSSEFIKNGSDNFELGAHSGVHLTPTKININSTGEIEINGGKLIWQIAKDDIGAGIQAGAFQSTTMPFMYLYSGGMNESDCNSCGIQVTPQGTVRIYAKAGGSDVNLSQLPVLIQADEEDAEDDPAESNTGTGPVPSSAINASKDIIDQTILLDAPFIIMKGNGGTSNRYYRFSIGKGAPSTKSRLNEFGSIYIDINSSSTWKQNKWSECKVYFKLGKYLTN